MKVASLDFETANYSDASICAAGVAVIENCSVTETHHWLVRPPKGHGYFRDDFVQIHGITWFDVCNEPEFPVIAESLLQYLTSADVVIAHNAQFDLRKLSGTLRHFGMACPPVDCICTLALSRRVWPDLPSHSLDAVAAQIGHQFRHHNAQDDAEAAGRLLLAMMAHVGVRTPRQLARALDVPVTRLAVGAELRGTVERQQVVALARSRA